MSKILSTERHRPRVRTVNDEPSMTVQSDRLRSEILPILAKYQATGIVEHMRDVDLQFRDVSEFEDFADLMRQGEIAKSEFMRLPSKLREVFDHDVNVWLDYAHSPDKLEELRPQLEKLGVMEPIEAPSTTEQNRTPDGQFASGRRSSDRRASSQTSPEGSGTPNPSET